MTSEFDIIRKYFSFSSQASSLLGPDSLGVGDDAAIVSVAAQSSALGTGVQGDTVPHARIVAACDTLVSGVHFPEGTRGDDLAARALAVNLSDFAAMGAVPKWLLMSLCLPEHDEDWLQSFSSTLRSRCEQHSLALIGGDTTRGPLTITFTVLGTLIAASPPANASNGYLSRSNALVDDDVWVSGSLGAAAGWISLYGAANASTRDWQLDAHAEAALRQAFFQPQARLALGQGLVAMANSAIDISDGLLAEAAHVAKASGVDVYIDAPRIPCHAALAVRHHTDEVRSWMLAGGDDYELLFTAPPHARQAVAALAEQLSTTVTRIGRVQAAIGKGEVHLVGDDWQLPEHSGYQHF